MAKQEPGVALPGQLEGADTHFSTDKTTNPQPVKNSAPKGVAGEYPKYVYVKDGDGFKPVLVSSEDALNALPEGWAQSPADHGFETHPGA